MLGGAGIMRNMEQLPLGRNLPRGIVPAGAPNVLAPDLGLPPEPERSIDFPLPCWWCPVTTTSPASPQAGTGVSDRLMGVPNGFNVIDADRAHRPGALAGRRRGPLAPDSRNRVLATAS